jgi:hypothetical protein
MSVCRDYSTGNIICLNCDLEAHHILVCLYIEIQFIVTQSVHAFQTNMEYLVLYAVVKKTTS